MVRTDTDRLGLVRAGPVVRVSPSQSESVGIRVRISRPPPPLTRIRAETPLSGCPERSRARPGPEIRSRATATPQ